MEKFAECGATMNKDLDAARFCEKDLLHFFEDGVRKRAGEVVRFPPDVEGDKIESHRRRHGNLGTTEMKHDSWRRCWKSVTSAPRKRQFLRRRSGAGLNLGFAVVEIPDDVVEKDDGVDVEIL